MTTPNFQASKLLSEAVDKIAPICAEAEKQMHHGKLNITGVIVPKGECEAVRLSDSLLKSKMEEISLVFPKFVSEVQTAENYLNSVLEGESTKEWDLELLSQFESALQKNNVVVDSDELFNYIWNRLQSLRW